VSASDDLKPWFDLQSATLDRVHSSWFRPIEPRLIGAARRNRLGRRWLANHLADSSPALFSLTVWRSDAADRLRAVAWLAQSLEDPTECALELGGVTLAGALRTLVMRDDVMKLKLALGVSRYDRVLQSQAAPAAAEHPAWTRGTVAEIADYVSRRGAIELAGYAERAHPACGESVRLSFDRHWWSAAWQGTLTATSVETALRTSDTLYEVVLTGTDA
jgi:hypothetical protein